MSERTHREEKEERSFEEEQQPSFFNRKILLDIHHQPRFVIFLASFFLEPYLDEIPQDGNTFFSAWTRWAHR